MHVFMNTFNKHDVSDFADVFEPLADAHRHPSVVVADEKHLPKDLSVSEEGAATPQSVTTIASLRAEIVSDVAASGHDSAYDRRS